MNTSNPVKTITQAQARRIAIAAQGLAKQPDQNGNTSNIRQLNSAAQKMGVIQIDSVNVLARAHLMPLFSRLGPYDEAAFHQLYSAAPRRWIETWAHEASFIPVETWPLLEWRRRSHRENPWRWLQVRDQYPELENVIRQIIDDAGPLTAAQIHTELRGRGAVAEQQKEHKGTGWWNWSASKRVLSHLFLTGEVASAGRTPQFERQYDLTTRVLPPAICQAPIPDDQTAIRQLVEIAARSNGIATKKGLQDYFRLSNNGWQKTYFELALAELVSEGTLTPVKVREKPNVEWYLHRDAKRPRHPNRTTLISPFDPLIFERTRLLDLFNVDYRLEIYTPAHKRVHGYYSLPFLDGDQITARVDLKADRKAKAAGDGGDGVLIVQATHAEPHTPTADYDGVASRLAEALSELATWLKLGGIVVKPVGNLAASLHHAVT